MTYTSRLKRAIRSSWILMRELNQIYKPVFKSWRLNERMVSTISHVIIPLSLESIPLRPFYCSSLHVIHECVCSMAPWRA